MVGRRIKFAVRKAAPIVAIQRASPMRNTAHQRGAHIGCVDAGTFSRVGSSRGDPTR
jgi:hypothetical protein